MFQTSHLSLFLYWYSTHLYWFRCHCKTLILRNEVCHSHLHIIHPRECGRGQEVRSRLSEPVRCQETRRYQLLVDTLRLLPHPVHGKELEVTQVYNIHIQILKCVYCFGWKCKQGFIRQYITLGTFPKKLFLIFL